MSELVPRNNEFWSFTVVPVSFVVNSIAHVFDLFEDLRDIGERDGVRFPTAVLYREGLDEPS